MPCYVFACRLLSFCTHVAAGLPFKRCDEPYSLVHLINNTIMRRGAFVLSAQKDSVGESAEAVRQGSEAAAVSGIANPAEAPTDVAVFNANPGATDNANQGSANIAHDNIRSSTAWILAHCKHFMQPLRQPLFYAAQLLWS